MNPRFHGPVREVARGLCSALEFALEPRSSSTTFFAAREVARVLGLSGLDALLASLEPHAGGPWPSAVTPVLDRLRRLRERCLEAEDVSVFQSADEALAALAREVASLEWSTRRLGGVQPTVAVSDALSELSIAGAELALASRLSIESAAALRAVLEWLGADERARPIEVSLDGGALVVSCTPGATPGWQAAHEVLARAAGALSPIAAEPGRWRLRLPTLSERSNFLLIHQGELSLALPWPAVLRVSLMTDAALDAATLGPEGIVKLKPLAPLEPTTRERPVVLIASGLRRAWIAADRLGWRVPAEAIEPPADLPAPMIAAVLGPDGELHGVPHIAALLAETALPAIVHTEPRTEIVPRAASAGAPIEVRPEPAPVARATSIRAQRLPAPPTLRMLGAADVEALPEMEIESRYMPVTEPRPVSAIEPRSVPEESRVQVPAPERASPPRPSSIQAPVPPPSSGAPAPHALVVEDSIMARVFLTRMLEARGFEVRQASTADEAMRLLPGGPWALVCADVDLPDGHGVSWLRRLADRAGSSAPIAALVRDRADRELADAAGVSRHLRKPFDASELDALLSSLNPTRDSR